MASSLAGGHPDQGAADYRDSLSTISEIRHKAQADDVKLEPQICHNLSFFKDIMKRLRKVDDNIMLKMGTVDCTSPKACEAFFNVIAEAYKRREDAIDYCLKVIDEDIEKKRKLASSDPASRVSKAQLYTQETQRQWIKNERSVEDIVRDRTLSVFKARCRDFSIPESFQRFLDRT